MSETLFEFEKYIKLGWHIIPIYPKSKTPMGYGWNKNYNPESVRKKITDTPDCNLGLLLGDIVDVEGDTKEANDLINSLTKDHPHPKFKSDKSIHHLFLNTDKNLTAKRQQGIEFRGYRHQSILPPSTHHTGVKYEWLDYLEIVQPMPPKLVGLYDQINFIKIAIKPKIKETHVKPWCSICEEQCSIHKKRYAIEVQAFKTFGLQWQCHDCRELDVRSLCRIIKNRNF